MNKYKLKKRIIAVLKGNMILKTLIYQPLFKYKWSERKVSYGFLNADKTFYVIRHMSQRVGLMGCQNYILWHIKKALEKGFLPIVDMQNYANNYLENDKIGKENSWEYYYKQPVPYTLEEVYKSKNVVLCSADLNKGYYGIDDDEEIKMFHSIILKYMKLNEKTEKYVNQKQEEILGNNRTEKILGVLCRGTDYVNLKPFLHAIPASAEETIKSVKAMLSGLRGYEKIYIATEDEVILEKFKREFEDKLLYLDCQRYRNTGDQYLSEIKTEREDDAYFKGLEYLTSIMLLANCDSIIGPCVGGTLAAVRINGGKYENKQIIDLGIYGE